MDNWTKLSDEVIISHLISAFDAVSTYYEPDRLEAPITILDLVIKALSAERILHIRSGLTLHLSHFSDFETVTDLIDGQLALREIADQKNWR